MKKVFLRLYMALTMRNLLNWMPDKWHISIIWYLRMPYPLNWKNPKTFNEKLNWLKLHDRKPVYTTFVDKYAVREHIKNVIGERYLIPLIGKYNSFDEIDFNKLPNQFVLKCNHGSHCSMICLDKSTFDMQKARKNFAKWMKMNWYWYYREWPYKDVKPCIICEQFMSNNGDVPEDYKVFCFNGDPKVVRVDVGRFKNCTFNFYTLDWKRSDIQMGPHSMEDTPKPACLDEMLKLSAKLSENNPLLRVDWYVIRERLYFGELTFYNAAGFDTDFSSYEDDCELGSFLKL